ncbi:hypothetical protein ACX1NA_00780 [Mycoplasma sp. VS276A1]
MEEIKNINQENDVNQIISNCLANYKKVLFLRSVLLIPAVVMVGSIFVVIYAIAAIGYVMLVLGIIGFIGYVIFSKLYNVPLVNQIEKKLENHKSQFRNYFETQCKSVFDKYAFKNLVTELFGFEQTYQLYHTLPPEYFEENNKKNHK